MSRSRRKQKRINRKDRKSNMTNQNFAGNKHINVNRSVQLQLDDTRFAKIDKRSKALNPLLYDLLTKATPHGHEKRISGQISQYIKAVGFETTEDTKGNMFCVVPKADGGKSATVFSCHMDTVHSDPDDLILGVSKNMARPEEDGMIYALRRYTKDVYTWIKADGEVHEDDTLDISDVRMKIRQLPGYHHEEVKQENGDIHVWQKPKFDSKREEWADLNIKFIKRPQAFISPSVLGADDKVGCYILCRLIKNKTPGMYIFHVGEEKGCIGSHYIAEKTPEVLQGYDRAIAFDRAGYGDVIAFQIGGRCASKKFTDTLAKMLNENMTYEKFNPYSGDVHGVVTDTAQYRSLVPECTNISVGYFNQHGPGEHFDPIFLEEHLLPSVLKCDFESLPTERVAGKEADYNSRYTAPHRTVTTIKDYDLKSREVPYKSSKTIPAPTPDTGAITAPYAITFQTPQERVPSWNPMDGYVMAAGEFSMRRMIFKYLTTAAKNGAFSIASEIIASLLRERDDIIGDLNKARITNKRLEELVDGDNAYRFSQW